MFLITAEQAQVLKLTYQNRGIGEAIAETLAKQSRDPLVLYATSRKGVDMKFETSPEIKVKYPKLDIANISSIQGLAKTIKEDHGAIDVLINNAGVNVDDQYSAENGKLTLDTNVRGTLNVSGSVLGIRCARSIGLSLPKARSEHRFDLNLCISLLALEPLCCRNTYL